MDEELMAGMEDHQVQSQVEDPVQPQVEEPVQQQQQAEDPVQPQTQPQNPDAAFARMRRSMEEQFKNSPEYQVAQQLSQMYGKPTDQLLQELRDAQLAQQAQQMQVPPELLRQQQAMQARIEQMEQEQMKRRFQEQYMTFKDKYPNVPDTDLNQAISYMARMHGAGYEDFTLEDAYRTTPSYAKVLEEQIRQQVLESMKQPNPLAPTGTPASPTAKGNAFSLSDKDFESMVARVKRGEQITSL